MSIDDRDLEMFPRRSSAPAEPEDGDGGSKVASYLGMLVIVAILGGLGFGAYKFFTNLPESPGDQKVDLAKTKPARETEFIVKTGNYPPPADNSRYAGGGHEYISRPMDRARQLVGELAVNKNTEYSQLANSIADGPPGAKTAKKGPPGPGCTARDVQDYFEREGQRFPDLPPDLVWGYDPETGKVFMAMR